MEDLGNVEVAKFDSTFFGQEDICAFEVPMAYFAIVKSLQSKDHLSGYGDDILGAEICSSP